MNQNLINRVNQVKPLLKKMLPAGLLHKGKSVVVRRVQRQMAAEPKQPYDPAARPFGLNLIGPVDAASGLGQSFRLTERAIRETGVPYGIIPFAATASNKEDISAYRDRITDKLSYAVNLWHVSPLEFTELYARMGRESFDGHYNIAYWLWELEEFPDEWVGYEAVLDEIWTPSEFISQGLRKKVHIPVHTIPYWVEAPADREKYDRKWFGLPEDQFLFLMMYDGKSVSERKNPDGVIKAYRQAFNAEEHGGTQGTRTDDGRSTRHQAPGLVIKAGSLTEKEKARLQAKLAGCPNTHIITGTFSKTEVNSLIACADVLVSLHRAEGFGLVMAEAMLNGVPVIATNWSSNTEFMHEGAACMVPYRLVTLNKEISPYPRGSRWAQPSINAAAHYMRRLAGDPDYRERKARRGQAHIRKRLGRERIVALYQEQLLRIQKEGR